MPHLLQSPTIRASLNVGFLLIKIHQITLNEFEFKLWCFLFDFVNSHRSNYLLQIIYYISNDLIFNFFF